MNKKGYWIIILSVIVTAILAYIEVSSYYSDGYLRISLISGSVAFSLFFWVFSISSRMKYLEKYIAPIDKLYFVHKLLSGLCIFSLIIHGNMMERYKGEGTSLVAQGGRVSLIMFVTFTLFSLIGLYLVRKNNNLAYELWKNLHRFMLLPFLIGAYHTLNNGYIKVLSPSLYGIWMSIVIFSGIILAVYSSILYDIIAFRKKVKILSVIRLNKDIVEITMEKPFDKIKEGQFAFFKFYGDKIKSEAHPFTISDIGLSHIKIAVKASGDFTKILYDNISTDYLASVNGPYGAFDYTKKSRKQLWIAGGIGVTPFMSFISSSVAENYNIKLYYVYKNNDDSVYKNDIMEKVGSNIDYHPVSTKDSGRPDFTRIISEYEPEDIFICGPVKMRESIINSAREKGFSKKSVHYEKFYF